MPVHSVARFKISGSRACKARSQFNIVDVVSVVAVMEPVTRSTIPETLVLTRRRSAAKLLTKDEARRMAVNFAKLPLRLSKPYAHRGEPVYGLVHHTG